jgi:hypothetical protein
MSDVLVESLCKATDEASNRVRSIYADEDIMKGGAYKKFGDTELYIHGGGFSGLWAIGLMQVFRALEDSGAMTIHVLHGYSIGAILAVFYACNLTTQQSIEAYYLLQEHAHGSGLYSACRDVISRVLPDNAHELCTGRVRVGMTQKFPFLWYREESSFPTRASLINAIVQSTSIPYVTAPITETVHNYVDGLFGHTIWGWSSPRLGRSGIELLPPCIGYTYVFSPTDPYIYGLIINGLTDIIYFLQEKPTKYIRHLYYMPWHVGKLVQFVDHVHWSLLQRVT